MTIQDQASENVRSQVREGYGLIAESASGCCGAGGGCCGVVAVSPDELARQIGYSPEELANIPGGANMGLSCGNPAAIAALKPGEVVLDLGSGGGFDAFLAAPKVGRCGRVIGVDMTAAMLAKARRNLQAFQKQSALDNVEFRLGEIEHLPVADASVDVVMSNCVINLSVDQPQVWREMFRVLRPGGRVAVSDMSLHRPLPAAVIGMVEALIGCVSGAALVEDCRRMAAAAGFTDIVLTPKADYVSALTSVDDPLYRKIAELLPKGTTVSDYITSLAISAAKPV